MPLSHGDVIDIVAPASACSEKHLELAVQWLEKQGYKARYDKDILKPQKFLAQTDSYRFKKLKNALLDRKSKAVWCLRGGYGSFRLWPDLMKVKLPKSVQPKLLIGLSDITSLHHFINQEWKWPSLHASLLDRIGQGKIDKHVETELMASLQGSQEVFEYNNLTPLNKRALSSKTINGVVRGGNLTTFVLSIGTELSLRKTQDKSIILFFEDIGERGYKVDRFLNHLKQSGVLKSVSALVFGDFTDCLEPNGQNLVPETLVDFACTLKIPVFTGLQSGHGDIQRPLFLNTPATLTCGKSGRMIVYSPYET